MANNHFKMHEFLKRETLVESLSRKIITALANAIEINGSTSLVLSGGSTPLKLLESLSKTEFAWERVRVTLVDERWVDTRSEMSNERLVRENLLTNAAKEAKFFGLKSDTLSAKESLESLEVMLQKEIKSLDVVVLGMGLDAHTASFFPNDALLSEALTTKRLICATTASMEPKERITLSRSFLLTATELFLHIEGKAKKEVFTKASQSDEIQKMPIIAMMQEKEPLLEVYYAE